MSLKELYEELGVVYENETKLKEAEDTIKELRNVRTKLIQAKTELENKLMSEIQLRNRVIFAMHMGNTFEACDACLGSGCVLMMDCDSFGNTFEVEDTCPECGGIGLDVGGYSYE
jgi:hypothetical protein